jgi:urease subunit alpha
MVPRPPTCRSRSSAKPPPNRRKIAYPTRRRRVGVRGTCGIGPADMIHNDRTAEVRVEDQTGRVTVDGELVSSAPADSVALSRLYFL